MPCPDKDFHVTPWKPSFRKITNLNMDYGRPLRKLSSLQGQKSNPNPKFLGMAEAYFVCQSVQKISLIYVFIRCLLGVRSPLQN